MKLDKAEKFKADFEYLVGQKYLEEEIYELAIAPSKEKDFKVFLKLFQRTNNSLKAIEPFISNHDLTVQVFVSKKLLKRGSLLHIELTSVLKDLDIEFNLSDY